MRGRVNLPGDCPLTWAVVGANLTTFVLSYVGVRWPLSFHPAAAAAEPWTLLTYALDGSGSLLSVLLSSYALWVFGGSLERGWLLRDYGRFLALTTAAPAAALWLAGMGLGMEVGLSGLWLPVAACAVAWSVVHPYERLLVYFAVPVEGRWIGPLSAALVFFSFPFPLGAFALSGCAVAWWYASGGRYGLGRGSRARLGNPLSAYRRWRRKREFRRLMRRSGLGDLH
jgi:hypothetical protein